MAHQKHVKTTRNKGKKRESVNLLMDGKREGEKEREKERRGFINGWCPFSPAVKLEIRI